MKHPKCAHSFEVISALPEPLAPLRMLANNFRWTWDLPTQRLFKDMDRTLYDACSGNPVEMMDQITAEKLQALAEDEVFRAKLQRCAMELESYITRPMWFQERWPDCKGPFAYFCAEFGVSETLPIYSGGLGVLAGDHLKACSDLGVPLVGVGLLYARGYFRQQLGPDGWQQEHYQNYDFYQMALHLERGDDGQPLLISVEFPDRTVTCQIWRADVGRIPLYLLDSSVLENQPSDKGITDTLYGGDEEMRIRQEMILGIGGMRALEALGVSPTVCHMNEGHAAFLSLERIKQEAKRSGLDFRLARQRCVNGNVFTTHTPVPAGFDVFKPEMLEHYLGDYVEGLGVPYADVVRMGRFDEGSQTEPFNMAVLAMGNSNFINGVSVLHAEVSRAMFHARWESYPEDEVPIVPVTNGIHTYSWISPKAADLFDAHLGAGWRKDPSDPANWTGVSKIPDAELWSLRENLRGEFVRYVRKYIQASASRRGMTRSAGPVEQVLDPRILTIGFARRFATYKRASLMLSDKERLKRLMFHAERPIQIVIAGKSHPRDDAGKKLIQELVHFIDHEGGRTRMVFLEDYDIRVARHMVKGVDVWLNNPRRPMEASGTSGMKVIPNGGLNCSILDGWWDEGFSPEVGWAIGDRTQAADSGQQDWLDSQALYDLIEHEISPVFYHRTDGVPGEWVERIKASIAQLAPRFSTARMVRDYAEQAYVPAHEAYERLSASNAAPGEAVLWRDRIQAAWPKLSIVSVTDNANISNPIGHVLDVTAEVELDGLSPDEVNVELVLGVVGPNRELVRRSVHALEHVSGSGSRHVFRGSVDCTIPGHRGYSVRIVPHHGLVDTVHELPLVCWQA